MTSVGTPMERVHGVYGVLLHLARMEWPGGRQLLPPPARPPVGCTMNAAAG
jgi:hypothetical protein